MTFFLMQKFTVNNSVKIFAEKLKYNFTDLLKWITNNLKCFISSNLKISKWYTFMLVDLKLNDLICCYAGYVLKWSFMQRCNYHNVYAG